MISPFYTTTICISEICKILLKIASNNIFSDSHNPDRVIFNFSSHKLTDDEKNVLCKGLTFSVKSGLIEYSEFLLPLELLFRDIKCEDLWNEDMSVIEARLIDTALTSYRNFSSDRKPPQNLTTSEYNALKCLSKNKEIVIQKADKGKTLVILDKCSYISVTEKIVNRIPTYTWLVWTLILYLLIFSQKKLSIFLLTTCTMTMRISQTSESILFVIFLT